MLCCCSAVLLLWTPAAAAKQQPYCAQGTRYHVLVQKIVRTSTIIYITYYNQVSHARTLRKSNAAPGITSRGFKPVFLFGCIHIYIFHIYTSIYTFLVVGSFFFLCGGRLFHLERYHKDIPDTTHHSYHTICVDKRYYVVSVTTTSTSFALHNYVCRAMFIRHTH